LPLRGRRAGDAGERQRGGQDVLAEAGAGVLGVERVQEQGAAPPHRRRAEVRVEGRRLAHFPGEPGLIHVVDLLRIWGACSCRSKPEYFLLQSTFWQEKNRNEHCPIRIARCALRIALRTKRSPSTRHLLAGLDGE